MISIDPGKRVLGVAAWFDQRLSRVWLVQAEGRNLDELCRSLPPRHGVPHDIAWVEEMDASGRRVPGNDLIAPAIVGAVYGAMQAERVRLVRPSKWKGRVPKAVHHPRIQKALDSQEQRVLACGLEGVPKGSRKEIMDAVGIGLWALGRKA